MKPWLYFNVANYLNMIFSYYSKSQIYCGYYIFLEGFTQAAASIMDASSSFSTRCSSVAGHEAHISPEHASASAGRKGSKSAKRRHTFNKNQIDSTPKMVTKFDRPYLERYVPPTYILRE